MARKHDRTADFPRGTLIDGKFRVERVLGAGGMGVVLQATHVALGQQVALKLLLEESADAGSETHRRFVQEAQVASGLVSENVVRVFDLGRTPEGAPYIVMELLRGQDLAAVVATESPLPISRAVDLCLGACQGVAAAHAAGLVHRDLKPANLFLAVRADGSRVVKVVDFGLSKVVLPGAPAMTASASSFGTPQYMAPEQIASVKHVDARCDQHALAMILFELCTSRPPYEGPTAAAIAVKIATHAPPSARALRRDVPAGLDAAIARALAKSPDDRFEDVGAFACAIAPFGGPTSVSIAAGVQATLAPTARARLGRRSAAVLDEDATTVPLPASGPALADSHDGVSSTLRERARRRRAFGIGVIAAALATSAGLGLAVGLRGPTTTAPGDASAAPAGASPVSASGSQGLEGVPPAEEAAAPSVEPAAQSAEPSPVPPTQPSASAASGAPGGARPARRPGRPTVPDRPGTGEKDPEDVFGSRRKGAR